MCMVWVPLARVPGPTGSGAGPTSPDPGPTGPGPGPHWPGSWAPLARVSGFTRGPRIRLGPGIRLGLRIRWGPGIRLGPGMRLGRPLAISGYILLAIVYFRVGQRCAWCAPYPYGCRGHLPIEFCPLHETCNYQYQIRTNSYKFRTIFHLLVCILFTTFGILGWIRTGHDIQQTCVKCQFQRFRAFVFSQNVTHKTYYKQDYLLHFAY